MTPVALVGIDVEVEVVVVMAGDLGRVASSESELALPGDGFLYNVMELMMELSEVTELATFKLVDDGMADDEDEGGVLAL